MDIVKSAIHPTEMVALIKFKLNMPKLQFQTMDPNTRYCYEMLAATSRSFTIVIQKLNQELRDPVMVFYLVLRALDTVEDDMSFPTEQKIEMLKKFHTFLYQPGWTFEGCGEGKEKELLQNFDKLSEVFSKLDKKYQGVIEDITSRMGHGMAEFIEKSVDSLDDWNKYCHYVAGLVGIGLSHLFYASQLEGEWFASSAEEQANSMGLFLQKTNIIRDYREDIDDTRIFWPKEIWSMYSRKLDHFKDMAHAESAVFCINHLITNALDHVLDVLNYMEKVTESSVFSFCAIPQVMAIATLALCYNNHDVFMGVVKIRRGETAKIFGAIENMDSLYFLFDQFAAVIEGKIEPSDRNAERTTEIVTKIRKRCNYASNKSSAVSVTTLVVGSVVVASAAYGAYVFANKKN